MFSEEEEGLFSAERSKIWHDERHEDLCEGRWHDDDDDDDGRRPPSVLHGPGYLYRPRQVLLEADGSFSAERVQLELLQRGGVPDSELDRSFAAAGLPVLAFLMPIDVYIPALVSELRRSTDGQPPPNIGPNHVFSGEPDYHGGPYGEPHNARAFSEAPYSNPDEEPPAIAVLDTGYDPAVDELHRGLAWRLIHTPADQETAVLGSGYLAPEGGHGTFIDGIIMRLAPQVRIRQVKVLNPAGVGDDRTVAVGLSDAGAPVVNLSLGGYTHDDMPPVALSTALARNPDVVAVAAAGNNDQSRPFWPAAFEQVVAVGALDTRDGPPRKAGFSNFGSWVDVYTPGVRIRSTYLKARWKLRRDRTARHIDGYAYWSGTSFAAPQVAALIATMIPSAGSAGAAADAVLASATQHPGLGPILVPNPGVVG